MKQGLFVAILLCGLIVTVHPAFSSYAYSGTVVQFNVKNKSSHTGTFYVTNYSYTQGPLRPCGSASASPNHYTPAFCNLSPPPCTGSCGVYSADIVYCVNASDCGQCTSSISCKETFFATTFVDFPAFPRVPYLVSSLNYSGTAPPSMAPENNTSGPPAYLVSVKYK